MNTPIAHPAESGSRRRPGPLLGPLLCLLLLGAGPAQAERMISAGAFEVHYNAIPTTQITPEVARAQGITRSAQRALVNIAVRHRVGQSDTAVTARVEGQARNDVGQTQTLWFREVREGDAIYYLAEPRIELETPIRFDIEVLPEGAERPIVLRFSDQFFAPP